MEGIMCKQILALVAVVLLCVCWPGYAQDQSYGPDWIKLGSWPGEYPFGLVTTKYVDAMGRSEPNPELDPSVRCELPKGQVEHVWSIKDYRQTDFIYWSRIVRYKALERVEYESGPTVEAGDVVEELGYSSEGYCYLRYKGVEFPEACLSMDEEKYERQPNQKLGEMNLWIGLQCLDGNKVYFLVLAGEEDDNSWAAKEERRSAQAGLVTSGKMIRDWGSVREDQVHSREQVGEAAVVETLNQDSLRGQLHTGYRALEIRHISRVGFNVIVERQTSTGERLVTQVRVSYTGKIL